MIASERDEPPVRFKIVPEPPTDHNLSGDERSHELTDAEHDGVIEQAKRAVPLVPASEEECCVRLMNRLSLSARDSAREWLTFLRALGLVVESDSGFRRRREDQSQEELMAAFHDRIYGAREVLVMLEEADEPLDDEAVAERFDEHVPQWERFRYSDPDRVWAERVHRILDWAVYFGLVERTGKQYRPTGGSPA